MTRQHIGAIVLAAGRSRRFGADKRESALPGGETMLSRSLRLMSDCVDDVVLVIGEGDDTARFEQRFPAVRVLRSPRSAGGMGYALADAVMQLAGWDACLVALADKPFVRPATVARVLALLAEHSLVVPTYRANWGHPVGFAHRYFHALMRLEGDSGARRLIEDERDRCHFFETGDPGTVADVDTPDQLDYWLDTLDQGV